MDHLKNIKERVRKGMKAACGDMLEFTDEPSREFNAEYLFTVATAKKIAEANWGLGDASRYKILLERDAETFAFDCLPHIKQHYKSPLRRSRTTFRETDLDSIDFGDSVREGRVDIAVYLRDSNSGYLGDPPLCVVEVKGFQPSKKHIIADLERNLNFLRLSGTTGDSVLQFVLFAALQSYKPSESEEKADLKAEMLERRYNKYKSEIDGAVEYDMQVKASTVSIDLQGRITCDFGENEIDISTRHHFVGVIVSFRAKGKSIG